jgi:hypothetical protein
LSEDISFGQGLFSNEFNGTFRLGDEANRSYWMRDRMYFRLTKWLAVGPELTYSFFNQWDQHDQKLHLVYEPSYGGMIKLSENADDPRFGLVVDGAYGDFVGTSWGVGFYYRF